MRIEQLEYITAVTKHGSLRRASEHLHISQPALSEAVSKLERELGVTLLDRHRSGARISPRGRALLQDMTEVLEAVERLRAHAGRPGRGGNTLTVGSIGAIPTAAVAAAFFDLDTTLPDTRLELITVAEADAIEQLSAGALDLALLHRMPGKNLPIDVAGHPVTRGRALAVLRPDHPLASGPPITRAQLLETRLIGARSGSALHCHTRAFLGPDCPPPAATADGVDLATGLVAAGVGVALLPDYSVVSDPLIETGQIVTQPLADSASPSHPDRTVGLSPVELSIVGRREVVRSTAAQALVNALRAQSRSARTPSVAAVDRGWSTG